MNQSLTVQAAAKQLGVSSHTLRYYEREGLLGTAVTRLPNGHRRYTEETLRWVKLLLCLRDTGMSLARIKDFALMAQQGSATIPKRLGLLTHHQELLVEHMKALQVAQTLLQEKIDRYHVLLNDPTAPPEPLI